MAQRRGVFTFWRIVIGLASVVFPAVAVTKIAGTYAARPDQFDWSVGAVAGTGAATAVLAVWTAALALSTADDVASTRELAEIEQKRFALEREPWIIASGIGWDPANVGGHASSDLVNAGIGPATGVRWEAHFFDESTGIEDHPNYHALPRGAGGVLLSGERADVLFTTWIAQGRAGKYRLRGTYRDADQAGSRLITFGPSPPEGWKPWLKARDTDPWWGLVGLDVDRLTIEHK